MAISEAKRLMREQIQAQQKKVNENKSKPVSSSTSHFELTDGISQWIPKGTDKGEEHAFDIVLFKAGPNFPNMHCNVEPGQWAYLLDIYVHRNLGPGREWVICPNSFKSRIAKGDKKGCPSCERSSFLQAQAKNKAERVKYYKKYSPQHRCMYYVIVRDGGKEEDKGVQVLDCYFPYMEEKLQDLAAAKRGRDEITYADIDEGKLICFKAVKKSFTDDTGENRDYSEYEYHLFLDRIGDDKQPYTIDMDLCDELPPLDSFLILKSYDEIAELLGPIENETKESRLVVDEDEEEEKPKTRVNRFAKYEEKEEEKVEDSVDSEDSNECPHGHTLGKHFLKKGECEDCEGDIYTLCRKVKKELNKK